METNRRAWFGLAALFLVGSLLRGLAESQGPSLGEVLTREGKVDYGVARGPWAPAQVGQALEVGDRVRTHAFSRATLRLEDLGVKRIGELTTLEILPPEKPGSKATINLKAGAVYLFMRGQPRDFLLRMPHAIGTSRGTDYHVRVDLNGRSVVTVFDGAVELSNPLGRVLVRPGEEGLVEPGQAPRISAVIQAVNLVQWWLYYPAVLDSAELAFSPEVEDALSASLEAYRSGDLLQALEQYPAGRLPQGDAERLYYASLMLAIGQVRTAEQWIDRVESPSAPAMALRQLIAAVTLQSSPRARPPQTASEWLAESFYRQKDFDLSGALAAAAQAKRLSPGFGFAWARLAELEFSFGHLARSQAALRQALLLSPRHAQAWALRGFVLSAQNRIGRAKESFEHAMELDGGLGNAWLGRGLCRIRRGDKQGGRFDLQVAAALEPNRSLFRSYLGKAFANALDAGRAEKELDLAKRLDPADPTPWLYSALLHQERNRINSAVSDLEQSTRLNDNRQVYRSRWLLDQDRAVQSANLASIYQSAGMTNVSVSEAARAVSYDYANHSAHLFLAESFNALRDPTRFHLRYETVWFNELLLAHLLAPVGAGSLSQTVSQQEYSKLFQANHLGLSTDTEWRSDGQIRERASQFGTFGNTSYALDLDYQHNDGVRPNNTLTRTDWYSRIKQQLTPQDSLFLLTECTDFDAGDNFQYFDPDQEYRPDFSSEERQQPNAVVGYHREWAPGMHTLVLGGRLENDQHIQDKQAPIPVVYTYPSNVVIATSAVGLDVDYENDFETFISELNQILQTERQTFVFGARFQSGQFHTEDLYTESPDLPPRTWYDAKGQRVSLFLDPPAAARVSEDFDRVTGYGYYTLEAFEHCHLTAGVAYDQLTCPQNYRNPPVFEGEHSLEAISPKAALVWSLAQGVTIRGAYLRSQGGVSFDESFRLEPAQLAGFVQSYRTIMPESIVGSVTAPTYTTMGGALDVRLASRTYLEARAQVLESQVNRDLGVLQFYNVTAPLFPWSIRQELDFRETQLACSIHQLVSEEFSVGIQYVFTRSELDQDYPLISRDLFSSPHQVQQSDLHRATGYGLLNHPSGIYAGTEISLFFQENTVEYANEQRGPQNVDLPGDEFVQINCFLGYRFPWHYGDVSLGLLNVTGADYRLNPLNAYPEMPRERVLLTRLRLHF